MFNTRAHCYQNISQVLLTSAFILWPTCTRGFGIREKSDALCGFLAYFCVVLRFSEPPYAPLCMLPSDKIALKQLPGTIREL